jgi:hypothetical protein
MVWDAICIDQQNNGERNSQVSLMRQIYSSAQKTVVGLGEEDLDSDPVVRWMSEFKPQGIDPYDITHFINHSPASPDLRIFCRRSWFECIWVVQEFVVGNQVEFQVGTKSFQAENMSTAIQDIFERTLSFMTPSEYLRIEDIQRTLRMFEFKKCREALVISQVLAEFRGRDASIAHDKIYGLLGLFKDLTLDAPLPDYDKPFLDVCIEGLPTPC